MLHERPRHPLTDHMAETPTLPFLGLLWTIIFCGLVFLSVWAGLLFIFLIGDAVGLKSLRLVGRLSFPMSPGCVPSPHAAGSMDRGERGNHE